jgi:glucan 1,3-beta-glucosidase
MHVNWLATSVWLFAGVRAQLFSSPIRSPSAAPSSSASGVISASQTVAAAVWHSSNLAAAAAAAVDDPAYWLADIAHQGIAAFNPNPSSYKVFRNVKDYGAKGTSSRNDTGSSCSYYNFQVMV